MVKNVLSIGLLALVLVSCGGDSAEPSTTLTPTTETSVTGGETALAVVDEWLDALAIGRYGVADVMVVDEQFVLLLAVESFSVDLYEALVEDGIGQEVSATFWESFVLGVRGFTGAGITEVEILGADPFSAYGRRFAEVEATSPRGDLTVVAILGDDARWHVDLLATFGSSFAPLFRQWVDRLPAGADAPLQALGRQRASLEVARDRAIAAGEDEARVELDDLLALLAG
ncbi:MAG: hypothetical protein OER12_03285 [Acidimicrobiia bacterium]|nr:hypothetical protein [Acidimicrobiia bacterium]